MKTINVRLPDRMAADIEAESRARNISKSDVVRERLNAVGNEKPGTGGMLNLIEDLIGPADGLPQDLSARTKYYLKKTGYGKEKKAMYGKTRR
jgi:hypothetical protein